MRRSVEIESSIVKKGVVLVLAVLVIVAGANGAVLERHDFGAIAPGGWANSGTSTLAALPQGVAVLAEDALGLRGIVAKFSPSPYGWLQVGADPVLAGITDKLSIDIWVYQPSTSTSMQRMVGRGYDWYIDQAGTNQFASFTFRDARASATPITILGSASLANSMWHHIVATYDAAAGTASLNVDGTIATGTSIPLTPGGTIVNGSTNRYAIGGRATSDILATSLYRGSVDDVRIYNEIIPEPITIALLGLGSMLVRRFRRRS
jgi:hypothetical protein